MAFSKNYGAAYELPVCKELEEPPSSFAEEYWEEKDSEFLENKWAPVDVFDEEAFSQLYNELSLEDLQHKHTYYTIQWGGSRYRSKIQQYLRKTVLRQNFVINQAICLAMGSLSFRNQKNVWPHKIPEGHVAMNKLVLFEQIIEILRTKHAIEDIYFQDSAFIEIDRQFLKSRGFKVLENGEARGLMTSETFLFAPTDGWHMGIENCIASAFPPLLISDHIERMRHDLGSKPNTINGVDVLGEFRVPSSIWKVDDPLTELKTWVYAKEMHRRSLLWPFYAHRISGPLLSLHPHDATLLDCMEEIKFLLGMWAYIVPDDKSLLSRPLRIEKEQSFCSCWQCQARYREAEGVKSADQIYDDMMAAYKAKKPKARLISDVDPDSEVDSEDNSQGVDDLPPQPKHRGRGALASAIVKNPAFYMLLVILIGILLWWLGLRWDSDDEDDDWEEVDYGGYYQ